MKKEDTFFKYISYKANERGQFFVDIPKTLKDLNITKKEYYDIVENLIKRKLIMSKIDKGKLYYKLNIK